MLFASNEIQFWIVFTSDQPKKILIFLKYCDYLLKEYLLVTRTSTVLKPL